VIVSFKGVNRDYVEVGANYFASHYLMPPEFLKQIPQADKWDSEKALEWASKLKVSTEALAYALKNANLIDQKTERVITAVRVDSTSKVDPELSTTLSLVSLRRKKHLLERGLSTFYVNLCFQVLSPYH
jgi:Zn-dependent peptidase ImmA (M78 family)